MVGHKLVTGGVAEGIKKERISRVRPTLKLQVTLLLSIYEGKKLICGTPGSFRDMLQVKRKHA